MYHVIRKTWIIVESRSETFSLEVNGLVWQDERDDISVATRAECEPRRILWSCFKEHGVMRNVPTKGKKNKTWQAILPFSGWRQHLLSSNPARPQLYSCSQTWPGNTQPLQRHNGWKHERDEASPTLIFTRWNSLTFRLRCIFIF